MTSAMKTESVNSFYNAIAEEYNSHMTESDKTVRETVSGIFKEYVREGNVLDFGGGTGLDLPWLLPHYRVFFLEPSVKMRGIARNATSSLNIKSPVFVDNNTNISRWSSDSLPMSEKMQGVLANFAVLNSIKDIDTFFQNIARVCDPQSHLVATILDPRLHIIFKKYSTLSVLRMFLRGQSTILNQYKGVYHETYLHSIKSIQKASHRHFDIKSFRPLGLSAFAVIIFSKK